MPSDSSAHVDEPSKPITPTRKQLSFSTPQTATVVMPESTGDNCSTSSADQPTRNTSRSVEHSSFSTPQDATGHDCTIGSLSTHVFETRTTNGRGHFACQDNGVSQIFIPSISNGEKILGNANSVV